MTIFRGALVTSMALVSVACGGGGSSSSGGTNPSSTSSASSSSSVASSVSSSASSAASSSSSSSVISSSSSSSSISSSSSVSSSSSTSSASSSSSSSVSSSSSSSSSASTSAKRQAISIAAGGVHVCAILDNFKTKCWGGNSAGQLGLGDTNNRGDLASGMGDNLPAVDFGTGRYAVEIALGYGHSCARLDNGQVKCWGDNQAAQLGLGDKLNRGDQLNEMGDNLPAVNLGTGRTAVELALGLSFTCARLDNNAVKCWGQAPGIPGIYVGDSPGETGDALPEVDFGLPGTIVQIAATAGNQNLCARSSTGAVLCMGLSNAYGQLGSGSSSTAFWRYVGVPNSTLAPINFGSNRTAIDIATAGVAPAGTGCALLDDNSLKCWGLNDVGQLGQGDIIDRGDAANEMGNNLLPINLGTGLTVKSMGVGPLGTCAILSNNDLKCWGHYMLLGSGQYPAMTHTGDGSGEMGDTLPRVNLGTNTNAQPLTAVQLATTTMSVCAILDNGLIKCWGSNGGGILGNHAPNASYGWRPNEMGDNLPYVDLGQ